MDIDLFQGVLLGLLAVGLIVLIALLATLGGIRKALEDRPGTPALEAGASPADEAPSETEPEPTLQAEEPEAQPVGGYTGEGSYATGRAGTIRSVLQQHGVGAEEQAADAPESHEPVVDSAFAAHADDPQEEPYQRDGRWWFRRGDELLIYDEASGQWQPAPEGETPAPSGVAQATSGAPGDTAAAAGVTTATQTESIPAVADQVTTYWKCPTCGAVNGSTAATCRMCFAARP